jgi:hypothetical protein
MKRLVFLLALVCSACIGDVTPQRVQNTSNPSASVVLLFETDGCRIFRFEDSGHYRYFAHCGVGVSMENINQYHQGKTTITVPDGTNWTPDR